MGNDTQEYDYTQDKSFLSAPVQTQHAYLLANNPNYATADPKTQGAYISHLRGYDKSTQFEQQNTPAKVEGSTTERAVKGVGRGLAGMGMGLYDTVRHPIDTAVGMYENAKEHWSAAKDEPTTIGKVREYGNGVPMLGPLAKSLGERYGSGDEAGAIAEGLTTAVGPSALKEVAGLASPVKRAIGRGVREGPRVLDPATQTTSKGPLRPWVKAVGGPDLLGGEKVLNAVLPAHPGIIDPRLSANERISTLKPWEPKSPVPPKPVDPVAQAVREGRAAKIPSRMPAEEPYKPYKAGPSAGLDTYAPNRSIGTPITGRSGVGPASPTAGVRRPFSGFVGSTAPPVEEGVSVVPEPRSLFPGEQPNYEASVPRDELLGQAQQRKPGAAKQLQQIGKTILYKPKPTIGRR